MRRGSFDRSSLAILLFVTAIRRFHGRKYMGFIGRLRIYHALSLKSMSFEELYRYALVSRSTFNEILTEDLLPSCRIEKDQHGHYKITELGKQEYATFLEIIQTMMRYIVRTCVVECENDPTLIEYFNGLTKECNREFCEQIIRDLDRLRDFIIARFAEESGRRPTWREYQEALGNIENIFYRTLREICG